MNNPMSYGVLTICLNAVQTLQQTIDSVLGQSLLPCHYVLIDGGSTDGSLERIKKNRQRAEKLGVDFELFAQDEPAPGMAGIPSAWNQGLQRLRGEVVFILNADDWYEQPDAAERVLNALKQHPDAGMAVAPVALRRQPNDDPPERILRPRCLCLLPILMPLPHPGCFIRRRVYDQIGLYDERYAVSADYDFIYRCRRAGIGRVTLDTPLVAMRLGGLAGRQRPLARKETREIALRHGRCPVLPRLAYALRTWFSR